VQPHIFLGLGVHSINGSVCVAQIDLSDNWLEAEGAKALVYGGLFKRSLTSVNLRKNNLRTEGARSIAEGIAAGSPALVYLNLSNNIPVWSNDGNAFAKALVEGGAFTGPLKSIDLGKNRIEAEGIQAFFDGGVFKSMLQQVQQRTPTHTNPHQPTPTHTNPHQPTPTHTNPHQPTPTHTNPHQATPSHTIAHQRTPTHTSAHQHTQRTPTHSGAPQSYFSARHGSKLARGGSELCPPTTSRDGR
jgi:cell division septation protein DedD